jgi:hypothetical protein
MCDACSEILPDLIVNSCPLGCDRKCARIWINETIDHKIICKCPCGHKKQVALQLVEGPEDRATQDISSSSQEQIHK